jgi:F0F1-type ATP synthase gamma subunit
MQIKEIEDELQFTHLMKNLAQSYEEIAVIRMKRIRGSVLRTRNFMESLLTVFYKVKNSYQEKVESLMRKKKGLWPRGRKKLAILVSANDRLYGGLTQKVFALFREKAGEYSFVIIIGKVGLALYQQAGIGRRYKYVEAPEFKVEAAELRPLLPFLSNYDQIDVYHSRFESFVLQDSTVTNISGDQPEPLVRQVRTEERARYLFEPSLERILEFFKSQVVISIFKQTLNESHLAHLASRINTMEAALGRVERRLAVLGGKQRRLKKLFEDKKQQERLVSVFGNLSGYG